MRQYADELRHARLAAGLSQARVADAARLSQRTVSRFEAGEPPYPDFIKASLVARVVGLEVKLQCFPAAGQLRDEAHIALISRLLVRLPSTIERRLEAPIQPNDQRAWDMLLKVGRTRIGVIAETRIRDLQALLRREHQKQLDSGVDLLLFLVASTKHNRAALADAGQILSAFFPLRTRAVLTRLGRGEAPGANSIVIL